MTTSCSVPGCGRRLKARGWCKPHYERWRKHGEPVGEGTSPGEVRRYFDEVVLPYASEACLIWPYARSREGYGQIRDNGRSVIVSRLVCERLNGPPPTPKHEAAHSCGNGHLGCVTGQHLSWKTKTENQADRLVHGTHNRGERCGNAKLTEADVLEIRSLAGSIAPREIAERFGIAAVTARQIIQRRWWAHVPEPARAPVLPPPGLFQTEAA